MRSELRVEEHGAAFCGGCVALKERLQGTTHPAV
jgi:hypothetical protein